MSFQEEKYFTQVSDVLRVREWFNSESVQNWLDDFKKDVDKLKWRTEHPDQFIQDYLKQNGY